jgi:glycerol-3-phosphate acyltransferase PlsY
MLPEIIALIAAYLLGSIPFGYLLVKYVFTKGEDVRMIGSHSTGATNVARRSGIGAGLLTYVLDVLKGAAAVMIMIRVADPAGVYIWAGAAAIAAILGHMYPIFLQFRGGKGVATGVGVFLVLLPLSVPPALVIWAAVVLVTRYVSLASITAAASVPVSTLIIYRWLLSHPHSAELVLSSAAGALLVILKHHQNIIRLISGTETRFGERVTEGDPSAEAQPKTGDRN